MRDALKKYNDGKWHRYSGLYEKEGVRYEPVTKKHVKTVLVSALKGEEGEYITEHMWLDCEGDFKKYKFKNKDKISFEAKVTSYVKGYLGMSRKINKKLELDYSLEFPSEVIIIS